MLQANIYSETLDTESVGITEIERTALQYRQYQGNTFLYSLCPEKKSHIIILSS